MSLIYTPSSSNQSYTQSGEKNPGLYLGGQRDAKNRDKLKKWGITHILNVTPEKEGGIQSGIQNYFPSLFTYKRIPVYDLATSDLLRYASQISSFISKGLHHGSVLVHCKKGKSRSVTCILFYLMQKCRMDLDQALSLVKEKREGADPIPAFLNQAKEWETKMIRDGVSLERKNKGNSAREKSNTTAAAVRGLVKGPARGPVRGPFTKCSNTYIQRGPKMEPKSSPLIGPRIGPFMGPIKEKTEESKSSSSNDERERKRRKVVEKNVASLASFPLTNTITETIGPQLPPSATDGKNSMKK